MKRSLRTAAAVLALSLGLFGLTACTDTDDDCDASGTTPITLAAASLVDGKGPGGSSRSGKSRSGGGSGKSGKSKSHGKAHDFDDDCEDDD